MASNTSLVSEVDSLDFIPDGFLNANGLQLPSCLFFLWSLCTLPLIKLRHDSEQARKKANSKRKKGKKKGGALLNPGRLSLRKQQPRDGDEQVNEQRAKRSEDYELSLSGRTNNE